MRQIILSMSHVLNHVALTSRSVENSDKFYQDLLGLTKVRTFVLPADLARSLFGIDDQCSVVDYKDDEVHFEIFLFEKSEPTFGFNHVCISVSDREGLMNRCAKLDLEFKKLPKGGDDIFLFIKDFDGNIFEVKEKALGG